MAPPWLLCVHHTWLPSGESWGHWLWIRSSIQSWLKRSQRPLHFNPLTLQCEFDPVSFLSCWDEKTIGTIIIMWVEWLAYCWKGSSCLVSLNLLQQNQNSSFSAFSVIIRCVLSMWGISGYSANLTYYLKKYPQPEGEEIQCVFFKTNP